MVNGQNSTQQRLYAIRVSVGIQAFCPALASEFMDRVVPSHPLQHIASVVGYNLGRFWAVLLLSVAILQDY